MSKSGSRYGRRSNWFKIHCLLQAQGHQNGINSSPGETNNNNSSISNNNSPNSYSNSLGKSQLPSTITSSFSSHERQQDDRDNREKSERERTPSSSASRSNGTSNGFPPAFSNLSRLSPESLSSLNRKLNSSDLADYFRAAGIGSSLGAGGGGGSGSSLGGGGGDRGNKPGSGKSFYSEDERGEDMSRTTRSPGSLESPRSETSVEDGKGSSTPLFTMPPGSPLEVKPNDLLSFDLITRDLMKMGYDPLRLWPAMIGAQPNLHQFNPYRFMFPNFPGAAAAAFPGGFPPNPGAVPAPLLNGAIHPTKLFSAASLSGGDGGGIPSPLGSLPGSFTAANLSTSSQQGHSPSTRASPPSHHHHHHHHHPSIRNRVTPIIPTSPSLTLTPPISHHGSDDPVSSFPIPLHKLRGVVPLQEKPIDLSAKSTNNNHVDDQFIGSVKKYPRKNGDVSDMEDDSDCGEESDHHHHREYHSDVDMKEEDVKSEFGDSDKDDEEEDDENRVEDLSSSSNNNNNVNSFSNKSNSRRSSCASRSPSTERVGTPLDLTRSSSTSNPSPPTIPKIAT
jgi:hypothetical protein